MSHTDSGMQDAIKGLLNRGSVDSACIIDDEYARVETFSEVDAQSRLDLYTAIGGSDVALEELAALGIAVASEHDISDEVLEKFAAGVSLAPTITNLMTQYGCTRKQPSTFLVHLQTSLATSLSLAVWTFSPENVGDEAAGCQLFFVDYMLDESSIEQSLNVAERLGRRVKELKVQPLVILISDKPNVNEIAWTAFRDKADLIGGMFHFFPKSLFEKESLFFYRLADIVETIEDARRIQHFVREVDERSQGVVERFRRAIKGLTLQDYGFIEKLSLQGEGQALGDYLVWLFGAYFGQMAADATSDSKNELDKMHFKKIPDVGVGPSPGFVGVYEALVSEKTPALATPEEKMPPELHLGDLFVTKELKRVEMVITPECDLVFTEAGLGTRAYDPARTVLLIPGELLNHDLGQTAKGNISDCVVLKDKRFRIQWLDDRVRSLTLKDVASTLLAEGFERVARLKPPFVLSVQGDVAHQLSRVGKPVGPLPSLDTEASIWILGADGARKKSTGAVRIYVDRKGERHALVPVATVEEILEIGIECEKYLAEAVRQQGTPAKYRGWLGELRALQGNLDLCLSLRGPHKLPKKGGVKRFEAKPICISTSMGEFGEPWTPEGPICLDIKIED